MKIAIGQALHHGPWGGGNRFVAALVAELEARGHVVAHVLEVDSDLALLTDPRPRNPMVTITPGRLARHLLLRNPRTVVVHRINECDERKGTRSMNRRLRLANALADHTVFIGGWLRGLRVWLGDTPATVIPNGADTAIFHARGHRPWTGTGPLRLVTHHWGAHARKGLDVYRRLDRRLGAPDWRERLAFTYIGNLPPDAGFVHVRQVPPLDGEALAAELRRHHAYVTASLNEPAGMHHIEGALCGLPLLFRRSGALPEYCTGFGEAFDGPDDVETALERLMANYDGWRERLAAYPHTAARMAAAYADLFEALLADRDAVLARRRRWRHPLALLASQVPL